MRSFDLTLEQPISLSEAANLIPGKGVNGTVNPSTIRNWILHGYRGVRLEGCRIGRSIFTSREAIARFTKELSQAEQEHYEPPTETLSHRVAMAECEAIFGPRKTSIAMPSTPTTRP